MVEFKKQIAEIENKVENYRIRLPLRLALTIPFVIIILAAVGLTGYLAFENGQTAVNDLVTQLFSKIEVSVEQHLDNYLGAPFIINQINLNAMQKGQLNSSDTEQMAEYFWQQGQLFSEVESMGFANNRSGFAAANHPEKYMTITDPSPTGIVLRLYDVGDDGRRTGNIRSEIQNFDVHASGWYQTAMKAGRPAWTQISQSLTGPRLFVTAVTPYYNKESLLGVFFLDVSLAEINPFLRNINISRNGQIFIMDTNGFIVATSTQEQPYFINGNRIERRDASSSSEPLISYAAIYLKEQFSDPGRIISPYQSTFTIQGKKHFVRVTSYRDSRGMDWKIVMVVPVSDFMAQIILNNRNTLGLIMVSLLLAIIVAAFLARRITNPLSHLSRSAKAVAQGDYDQRLAVNSGDEVGELMDSFNTMAVKLKENLTSIQESEERFRALVEQAPEAILVLDCDNFLFVDANKKAEELFGCSREELRKSGPQQFYTPPQPDEKPVTSMHENIDRALAGELVSFERRVNGANGIDHLCQVWLIRLPSAKRKLIRVSYIDITESKHAEEELRKYREHLEELVKERTASLTKKTNELTENQAALTSIVEKLNRTTAELVVAKERAETADMLKSVFLATMSHELRTPLNSIIGFTGIILQGLSGPINSEQSKQLEMVNGSAKHLLALINDVLDISKIEAGQFKISIAPFEMKNAIESVVAIVTPLAEKKGLPLHINLSPRIGTIVSDQRRVEQILFNLLSNAIKFTEKGDIKVECHISEGQIITQVIDTGIGIKPEHMDKLFKPFIQLENGLTRRFEGTGLGLSISKKLVEMLGGRISAQSEYQKGSVFTFTLPITAEISGNKRKG
jgi:PAS domain S-box-containing protein